MSRAREGDPLKGRRVVIDGRSGVVSNSHIVNPRVENRLYASLYVRFDDRRERDKARRALPLEERRLAPLIPWAERFEALTKEQLDEWLVSAPDLATLPVDVRQIKVIARGHKDQIAQRFAALPELTEEQLLAGYRRFIQFTPDVAAYRRWRIVMLLPSMSREEIVATPDEHPRAASERRARRDYAEEPRYGY